MVRMWSAWKIYIWNTVFLDGYLDITVQSVFWKSENYSLFNMWKCFCRCNFTGKKIYWYHNKIFCTWRWLCRISSFLIKKKTIEWKYNLQPLWIFSWMYQKNLLYCSTIDLWMLIGIDKSSSIWLTFLYRLKFNLSIKTFSLVF